MARVLFLVCLACAAWASETEQPPCTRANNGQLWPAQANTDRAAFAEAMRSGEIEICNAYGWKRKWERLLISVPAKGEADRKRPETPKEPPASDSSQR